MSKTTAEKIGLAFLAVGAALGAFFGIRHLVTGQPGPPPPPPDKANLWGRVTNAITGQAIGGIQITVNGYDGLTEADGSYLIENIEPSVYDVTFSDPQGRYAPLVL